LLCKVEAHELKAVATAAKLQTNCTLQPLQQFTRATRSILQLHALIDCSANKLLFERKNPRTRPLLARELVVKGAQAYAEGLQG
jgi:hypothetical protein